MTEELLEFENTIEDDAGRSYVALVLGEAREDGRWVGRIRFTAAAGAAPGSAPFETDRETTQPNRDDLEYWATGLTYSYLEGALERALRRAKASGSDAVASAADVSEATSPALEPAPSPSGTPHLEVASADPGVVQELMGTTDPRPGTVRHVPGAGVIVYEGLGGADGPWHAFAVRFGSRNAGATLANWLWSRLHGTGAQARVDGQAVELTNDALNRALLK